MPTCTRRCRVFCGSIQASPISPAITSTAPHTRKPWPNPAVCPAPAPCTSKPVTTGADSPANEAIPLPIARMPPRCPLGVNSASMAGPTEYITSASPPLKVRLTIRSALLRPGRNKAADSSPLAIRHTETNAPRDQRVANPARIIRCDSQAMNRLSGVVTTTNRTNTWPVMIGSIPSPVSR